MKNIVIFASGSGSNAEKIMLHLKNNPQAKVVSIFTNNSNAKVIERAQNYTIPCFVFTKTELYNGTVLTKLIALKIDLIVLAGFLLKIPFEIINCFPSKIINIHPALLPKYGGKGMYGNYVHQAVLDNYETETGITIHYVNENYDEGNIIFQKSILIKDCKTAEEIAEKIHALEHQYYPEVVENIISKL